MKSKNKSKHSKTPENKDYNPNRPQDITRPKYNSDTDYRPGEELPQIENLNQQNDEKDPGSPVKEGRNRPSEPVNDESLHGKKSKTDLGNGQKTEKKKEQEKIIRT